MTHKPSLPPVDVWRLIDDGIDSELRAGINRAFKHSDAPITDADIERIVDQQHIYLMNWFAETFRFNDEE